MTTVVIKREWIKILGGYCAGLDVGAQTSTPIGMRERSDSQSQEIADPILATRDVVALIRLHPVTIWRLCRAGDFPLPIKLTGAKTKNGRNGWPRSQIIKWLATRPTANYGARAA
jgi:predicted DNA-binding transcriptional regulator AlpA